MHRMVWLGLLGVLLCIPPAAAAENAAPRVVVSLLPLHSLVATIMAGVGEPELLLPGGASPHAFALRPSQVRTIEQADLLIWVGPELETFLSRSAALVQGRGRLLTLGEHPELAWLVSRAPGLLDEPMSDAAHRHEADHHHPEGRDYHLWLSPSRSARLAALVADELATLDPQHAARYRRNSDRLAADLEALSDRIDASLTRVRGLPYVVFHDAYRYFEAEFGISPVGIVAVNPERPPGARRIVEIRERIKAAQVRCVFSEPQFEPKLVRVLTEGTGAGVGVLDPLGAQLEPGPAAYRQLLEGLAASLAGCLDPS